MEKIRLIKLIKDSIIAGILIGFGCITNVSCNNPVVGAFLFSLGLFAVIIQGRYLFTGKIGYCGNEEITGKNYELVLGLFTNLISVWLLCFLFAKFSSLSIECNELVSKKEENQIKWVGLMNNFQSQAEEIVKKELIFV